MARNRFAGPCKDCGQTVDVGCGYFERQRGGGWKTRHVLCVAQAHLASGSKMADLTLAQQHAVREAALRSTHPTGADQ